MSKKFHVKIFKKFLRILQPLFNISEIYQPYFRVVTFSRELFIPSRWKWEPSS